MFYDFSLSDKSQTEMEEIHAQLKQSLYEGTKVNQVVIFFRYHLYCDVTLC